MKLSTLISVQLHCVILEGGRNEHKFVGFVFVCVLCRAVYTLVESECPTIDSVVEDRLETVILHLLFRQLIEMIARRDVNIWPFHCITAHVNLR